jgi:RND family efflux transporter MFP subunit
MSAVVLCVLSLTACRSPEPEVPQPTDEAIAHEVTITPEQQQAIGLTTALAVEHQVGPTIESFGRVIPRQQGRAQVTSPVAGRVTTQSAERIPAPGTVVRRGQLLAEVEQTYTALERVQLDVGYAGAGGAAQEAKAALDAAAAEYQRSQTLFTAKIVSRKRVEEAKAAWLQAQSRFETAQRQATSYGTATVASGKQLRRFALTAPIAGVVVQADLTAGQQVDTTTPLFVIADSSTVWIEAPIFEDDVQKIEQTRPVTIRTPGDSQASWIGRPRYTGTVVDPLKRTTSFVYEVANADGRLRLGMSVTVALPIGPERLLVTVPEAALIEGEKGNGVVYIRRSPTQVVEQHVTIGERRDGFVAVTGDITAGQELVVTGVSELFGMASGRLMTEE